MASSFKILPLDVVYRGCVIPRKVARAAVNSFNSGERSIIVSRVASLAAFPVLKAAEPEGYWLQLGHLGMRVAGSHTWSAIVETVGHCSLLFIEGNWVMASIHLRDAFWAIPPEKCNAVPNLAVTKFVKVTTDDPHILVTEFGFQSITFIYWHVNAIAQRKYLQAKKVGHDIL